MQVQAVMWEKNNVGAASPSAWDNMIGLHPATVGTVLNESGMAGWNDQMRAILW